MNICLESYFCQPIFFSKSHSKAYFLRRRAAIWFVKQCWVSHSIELWRLYCILCNVGWKGPEQTIYCEAQTGCN